MATHSSTLAWKIPWTEEPGRLQSMGSWRVRHDWATSLSLFIFMHWRRKWQPTPVLLPGESQGRGAWWAAVYGVAQSRTRLKRLSSSSKEGATPREEANYKLGVIMMCQCRFINCSKCVTLLGKVDHEGGCGYMGAGVLEDLWTFHSLLLWNKNCSKTVW